MGNSVTIGQGTVIGTFQAGGVTMYVWSFDAVVNGQSGVIVFSTFESNEAAAAAAAADFLEEDPDLLEGVGLNDSDGADDSRVADGVTDSLDDTDDALASAGGDETGDSA